MNEELNYNNNEIWKDIPEYENFYQASNLGRIRSLDRIMWVEKKQRFLPLKGKILKPKTDKDGYLEVVLCKNGKHKFYRVHQLIGKTFIQNINNLPQINHVDSDKQNNNSNNLEWVTCQQNGFHKWKKNHKDKINILLSKEEYSIRSLAHKQKLNPLKIREIRSLYFSGKFTQQKIADLFQVSNQYISSIVRNEHWKGDY